MESLSHRILPIPNVIYRDEVVGRTMITRANFPDIATSRMPGRDLCGGSDENQNRNNDIRDVKCLYS